MTRRMFHRLMAALVTFIISVTCVGFYRDYQLPRKQLLDRESQLRNSLFRIRFAIDRYAAQKGELPQSLDDLVTAECLRQVPIDPIRYRWGWRIEIGDDLSSTHFGQGINDVHSTATELSSEGTPYSEW
jgi:general secretion pathway protein G